MSKIIKWISLTVALLIVIMILILSILNLSAPLQHRVVQAILLRLNNHIPGELSISSLEGNIFNDFTLCDLLFLDRNGHTIMSADKVRIKWQFLDIFFRKINISLLEIDRYYFGLVVGEDGPNIARVFSELKIRYYIDEYRFLNIPVQINVSYLRVDKVFFELKSNNYSIRFISEELYANANIQRHFLLATFYFKDFFEPDRNLHFNSISSRYTHNTNTLTFYETTPLLSYRMKRAQSLALVKIIFDKRRNICFTKMYNK